MSGEFDRLIPEFLALARRIFDAGVKAENDRLLDALQRRDTQASIQRPAATTVGPRKAPAAFGAVSLAVLNALAELMPTAPAEGIGAGEVVEVCQRHGKDLSEAQVRAALKGLAKRGDAIRASRGRFLLPPESEGGEEEPGGDAPGSVHILESMAAE